MFLKMLISWWVALPAIVALLGGAFYGLARELRGWGRPARPSWKLSLARPINAAHRGGDGILPENTLTAFLAARDEFGCGFMELDVHASRDGVPVVIHDATVDRTTDGSGAVTRFTLAELKRLEAGAGFRDAGGRAPWAGKGLRIPTLEELLTALPDSIFSVDIKQRRPPCEAAVAEVVARLGMERQVLLGSASHALFQRIRAAAPGVPSSFSMRSGVVFFLAVWMGLAAFYRPPHNALLIPETVFGIRLITPRMLRAARRLGLPVLVWTIDDPGKMRELLRLGVDGIITGRPDLLAEIIREQA